MMAGSAGLKLSRNQGCAALRMDQRDQTLKSCLPRTATRDVAPTGGRKPRLARWMTLLRDRRAVVALEYALIAGVMVFVVFTVSSPFAAALSSMFTNVANQL